MKPNRANSMTIDELAMRCDRAPRTVREHIRANYNLRDAMIGWNVRIEIAFAIIEHFRNA
jgi:predicted transcriptional regulator